MFENIGKIETINDSEIIKFDMVEEINHALTYYIPEKGRSLKEIASDFYDVTKEKDKDEATNRIVESLKKTNTGIGEYVNANQLLIIPNINDIQPRFVSTVPVPKLPDTPPPPNPTPPDPLTLQTIGIITRAEHIDQVHPGCVYFWEFFKKLGPIQERNNLIGSIVWVRFEGRASIGISLVEATIESKYCVYQADRYLVERWQWEEIWGQFRVLCAEGGHNPAKSHGKVMLSGKWVKLDPNIQRNGQERMINCFWSAISESDATTWANNYAQQDPFASRGTDQLP